MERPRHAVYYAPPAASPLWRFGCAWLGRDPESGCTLSPPDLGLSAAEIAAQTRAAAGYGFHATLKPPFMLADGSSEAELLAAVAGLAGRLAPAAAPGLVLGRIGGFLALVPAGPSPALSELAAACVAGLDRFRAPAAPEVLARRRRAGLTPAQEANLQRWGYPYVMEEFRFHLTLTDSLAPAVADRFAAALAPALAAIAEPVLSVGEVAVYRQDGLAAPFALVQRFPLG